MLVSVKKGYEINFQESNIVLGNDYELYKQNMHTHFKKKTKNKYENKKRQLPREF